MPGYLTNRLISIDIATAGEVAAVQAEVDAVEVGLAAAIEDIEDLQLNIGV